jgi:Rod binding domain-containing protein
LTVTTLPISSLPPIDPTLEPAAIRNGDTAAKQAYQVGLSFEQMLVDQLSQQLTATAGLDGSTDGSSDDSSGATGTDAATGAYAQMLPDALSSSVMSGGGLGVAAQIAQSIDPALGGKL